MKIIEFAEPGNPAEVLRLRDIPSEAPGARDVRVKVLATPIHPANLLQIAGQYASLPELPSVPGGEGVGEVVDVGSEVTHLKPGQRVLLAGTTGTWREELTVPAATLIPAPPGDPEQLSMAAVNPLTAHLLLSTFRTLKKGDWIIQSAANSAVGQLVIQMAALHGIRTVNIVRRDSVTASLKAMGADVVLTDGDDLASRVNSATQGEPIHLAFDSVAGETFEHLVGTLSHGATIVSYGVLSSAWPRLNLGALIANDIRVRGFWLAQWFQTTSEDDRQAAFGSIMPLLASGQIKVRIDSRFPLTEFKEAVTRAAENGRDGKVLLTPNAEQ